MRLRLTLLLIIIFVGGLRSTYAHDGHFTLAAERGTRDAASSLQGNLLNQQLAAKEAAGARANATYVTGRVPR